MREKLAIVGAEEHTRDLAPWNDDQYDIWVFNEYPAMSWVKRYDASFQMHLPESYTRRNNDKFKEHWNWLQEERNKTIWMQDADRRVPDSAKYPLEEINKEFLSTLTYEYEPVKNYRATLSYAIALGLYLGYKSIDIYGVELVHTREYRRQQSNFAFWVGVATGRKVPVNLHCSRGTFDQPLYGYEVDMEEGKIQNYITGMTQQYEETQKQLLMIEGALKFARQLLEDEKQAQEAEKASKDGAPKKQGK